MSKYHDNDGIATRAGVAAVGCLVLDVLGRILEVGRIDVLVLTGVIVGCLAGGHQFFGISGGSGSGDGGGVGGWRCVVGGDA